MRPVKVQVSLRNCVVLPEPLLIAHTKNESGRSLSPALLTACKFEQTIWVSFSLGLLNYRVKSGNLGRQVNSDSDLVYNNK